MHEIYSNEHTFTSMKGSNHDPPTAHTLARPLRIHILFVTFSTVTVSVSCLLVVFVWKYFWMCVRLMFSGCYISLYV